MRMRGKKPIFNYKDCWSMDLTLSPIICEGLKKFKQELEIHPARGYPAELHSEDDQDGDKAFQDWLDILDKMIYAFDLKNEPKIGDYGFEFETVWETLGNGNQQLVSIDPTDIDEYNRYKQDEVDYKRRKDEGLHLFAEYFENLWI